MPSDPFTRAWREFSKGRGGRLPEAVFKAFRRGWGLYILNVNNVEPSSDQDREDAAVIAGYVAHGAAHVEDRLKTGEPNDGTTD